MRLSAWGSPRPSQSNFPPCRLEAIHLADLPAHSQSRTSSSLSSPANRPADFAIPSLCYPVEDWSLLSASYGEKTKKLILASSDSELGHPLSTYMKQVWLCSAPPQNAFLCTWSQSGLPAFLPPEHSFLSPPPPPLVHAADATFSLLEPLCGPADKSSE